MPWKGLLIAMPFVAVWTYYDTKQDIAHIEGAQMALERVFVDTQERAMTGVPRGPMPITEEPTVDQRVVEIKEAKQFSQPPADYRRGLAVVRTQQTVDYANWMCSAWPRTIPRGWHRGRAGQVCSGTGNTEPCA
jgi:hypothetical protein